MITNDLSEILGGISYQSLPGEVVETAKSRILDYLGIVIAGYDLGSVREVKKIYASTGHSTVFGYGEKMDLRSAAVINGFMAHSTWYEDGSRITGGHPSSSIFPALFALAEDRHASGKDFLAATIAGYEVFNRIGSVMYPATVRRGFQPTGLLAPMAAASACACLMHLPKVGIARAMNIAAPQGSGLKSAFKGGDAQPIQIGRASEAGLVAALMAEQGIKGFDGNLEAFLIAHGFNDGATVDVQPIKKYQIKNTYVKIHGGCRGNHAPLDVALRIVKDHSVKPEDVDHIEIDVDSVTAANEIHNPKNRDDAQFNAAFSIAVALLKGNALLPNFSNENVEDPAVRAFMEQIQISVDLELDKLLPDKRGARGRFFMKNGEVFEDFTDMPEGEPERPLSYRQIAEKFSSLTKNTLGPRTQKVIDTVSRLEELTSISELTDLL